MKKYIRYIDEHKILPDDNISFLTSRPSGDETSVHVIIEVHTIKYIKLKPIL